MALEVLVSMIGLLESWPESEGDAIRQQLLQDLYNVCGLTFDNNALQIAVAVTQSYSINSQSLLSLEDDELKKALLPKMIELYRLLLQNDNDSI